MFLPHSDAARSAATASNAHLETALVFGVDLGGTKVLAALAGATGGVIAERVESTDPRGGRHVIEQIHTLATRLCAEVASTPKQIHSVVVGSPGVVEPNTGAIELVPNIAGLAEFDVARALEKLFQQEVVIENDAKLAMLGEAGHGCAIGCQHAAFLSIGTGVGLGLIVNGQLLRGATGAAGEIAYLPLGPQPDAADALKFGAFEVEAGSVGILRRYQAQARSASRASASASTSTSASASTAATVRDFFEHVVAGEALACAVLDETAHAIALAITALYAIVDPAIVVMGGSIGNRIELLERVRRAMGRIFTRPVRIEASALGHRAGLLGAIALAQDRLTRPPQAMSYPPHAPSSTSRRQP